MPAILFENGSDQPMAISPLRADHNLRFELHRASQLRVNLELQQSLQTWTFKQSETIELLSGLTENPPPPSPGSEV